MLACQAPADPRVHRLAPEPARHAHRVAEECPHRLELFGQPFEVLHDARRRRVVDAVPRGPLAERQLVQCEVLAHRTGSAYNMTLPCGGALDATPTRYSFPSI